MLFFNDHDLLSRMTALILVHKHWTWNRKQYPFMLLILYVHMCWASYPQFWWMGVKGLWRVLQPIKEKVLVSSLRGKVLAVDLAIWVVQSETVTNNELQKIYLRQMFYKVKFMCIDQQITYQVFGWLYQFYIALLPIRSVLITSLWKLFERLWSLTVCVPQNKTKISE